MSLIDTSGLAHYDEEYVQPIMDSIAPTESGSTSAHDYAIGQEFYHNNLLYKAKTAITTGDTFVVGTNIELAQDIATQISNAGGGGLIDTTWQDYQALPEQQKLDPGKAFFIDDLDFDYDNLRDIVAPTEAATAVGNRAIGDEFILGDYLYKAISAIAQGDPIVTSGTGQNAALAGTIVDQLKALFDGESELKNTDGISDCNTGNTTQGIRWYLTDTQSANAPTTSYGILLEIVRYSTQVNQFYMVFSGSDYSIYFRSKGSGSWPTTGAYGWKQIYGQTILTGTQLATTIANSTQTNVASIANVPAGTYLVRGRIIYSANTTGVRDIGIVTSATSGTMDDTRTAVSAGVTTMSVTLFLTLSSSGTIYMHGYQNSGSTLDLSGIVLQAYKLY